MTTPHKHAALIKAWADGAEIEHYNVLIGRWVSCELPMWAVEYQYRIKPEKKWFRVAEFHNKNGGTKWLGMVANPEREMNFEKGFNKMNFSRWITDRIYYE